MPTLVTTILKMQRAKEHLDALEIAIREFERPTNKPKAYRVSGYDDLECCEYVLKLEIDEPKLRLGITAGEFVSCLRSSLDWLAWQLATISCSGDDRPSDKISFPIWGEYSARAESKIEECTVGIPAEAVAIMQELQPYHYRDAYRDTHLWRLHALWNMEKHRHLVGNTMAIDLFIICPPGIPFRIETTDNGGEVRFPLSAKDKVGLDPAKCRASLRFGDEKEGVLLDHRGLVDIYEFVSDKVVPRFKRFFPQTPITGQPIQI